MKYFDLEVREFSDFIIARINGSPLPVEVKRLAMVEICDKLEKESNRLAILQSAARDKERLAEEAGEGLEQSV